MKALRQLAGVPLLTCTHIAGYSCTPYRWITLATRCVRCSSGPSLSDSFAKAYGGDRTRLEVSPVKRPLMEGTLSFSISENVEVTLVSDIIGTHQDAVTQEVYKRALQLHDSLAPKLDGLSMRTFFHRQLMCQSPELFIETVDLDVLVRLAFTSLGSTVRCCVTVWDTWIPNPKEEVIAEFSGPPQNVDELLSGAGTAISTHLKQMKLSYQGAAVAELQLRADELIDGSNAACRMQPSWATPPLPVVSCGFHSLVYRDTAQSAVVKSVIADACGNLSSISMPLLAIHSNCDEVSFGYYYESLSSAHTTHQLEELVSLTDEQAPSATWSLDAVTQAMDSLWVHSPVVYNSLVGGERWMGNSMMLVHEYIVFSGRTCINQWLCDMHGTPHLPSTMYCGGDLPPVLPHVVEQEKHATMHTSLLARILQREHGWHGASMVPCFSSSPHLNCFYGFLGIGDDDRIFASRNVYNSISEALRLISPWLLDTSYYTPPLAGGATRVASVENEEVTPVASTPPMEVMNVTKTLQSRGVVQCDYNRTDHALRCIGASGDTVHTFYEMDTVKGLERLLRFCAGSKMPVYVRVDLNSCGNPFTILRWLLCHMMSNTSGEPSRMKTLYIPTYGGLRVPLPFGDIHYATIVVRNKTEMAHYTKKLLTIVCSHSRGQALPIPLYESHFFDFWPPTAHTVSCLRKGGNFSYSLHSSDNDDALMTLHLGSSTEKSQTAVSFRSDAVLQNVYDALAHTHLVDGNNANEMATSIFDWALDGMVSENMSPRDIKRLHQQIVHRLLQNHDIYKESADSYALQLAVSVGCTACLFRISKDTPLVSGSWKETVAATYLRERWKHLGPFVSALQELLSLLHSSASTQGDCKLHFTKSVDGHASCNVRLGGSAPVFSVTGMHHIECAMILIQKLRVLPRVSSVLDQPSSRTKKSCSTDILPTTITRRITADGRINAIHESNGSLIRHYQTRLAKLHRLLKVHHDYDAPRSVLRIHGVGPCGLSVLLKEQQIAWNDIPRHIYTVYSRLCSLESMCSAAELSYQYHQTGALVKAIDKQLPSLKPLQSHVHVSGAGSAWQASLRIKQEDLLFDSAGSLPSIPLEAQDTSPDRAQRRLLLTLLLYMHVGPEWTTSTLPAQFMPKKPLRRLVHPDNMRPPHSQWYGVMSFDARSGDGVDSNESAPTKPRKVARGRRQTKTS